MKTELTKQEKEFFQRHKSTDSKIKIVLITITVLLAAGLLLDALNGFWVLKEAKSFVWGIGGLFLLSIFYLIGEAGSEWISSKDNVSHPLYKRVFHLVLLLGFLALLAAVFFSLFKHLG